MPDVRLYRTERQRRIAPAPQRGADGARLHRIARAGAGAVRLHEVERGGGDARPLVDGRQQAALPLDGGEVDAVRPPVRVHADGAQQRARPGVAPRLGELAQHQRHRALAAHIAVGQRREGARAAGRREHPRAREADEGRGRGEHVHPAHDGELDPPALQRHRGLGERDDGGGAGRVQRQARALEVEDIGDAVGDDGQAVARHEMRLDGAEIEERTVRVVGGGGADIDAHRPPGKRGGGDARILQRLPHHLEHEALLGVHLRRLARRKAEGLGVEGVRLAQIAAGEGVGGPAHARVGVEEALGVPAVGRGAVGHGGALLLQHRP